MKQANGKKTMNDEDGVTYSPSELSEGWVLIGDSKDTMKHLNKIRRQKGKKAFSMSVGLTEYFDTWVNLSFQEIRDAIEGHSSRRFSNATIDLVFHVKTHIFSGGDVRVSVWPTVKRNENLNASNNWGEE